MKSLHFFLILFFVLSLNIHSQQDSSFVDRRPAVLGVSFDYGYLLKHTESLRNIGDSYPVGVRLDWSKQFITSKSWEFCSCFPRIGMSVAYWDWDNPEILGSGIIALGYIEPHFRTHKRTNIFFRMAIGGAFLTNPYDEVSNPQNLSYSTVFGFPLVFGVGLNYRIDDQWNLRFAAKYNHISNGGSQTPNKGLNFPSLSAGVNYNLTPITYPVLEKNGKRAPPDNKNRWSIVHFSGWSNANVGDTDKFYVFGFLGNYSRWIGGRSALNFGTEWIFDLSRKELIRLENSDASFPTGAILVGHEFWLGRVTFSQKFGIYYFNQYRNTPDIYERYGLTYYFSKHIFGGVNLKAHGADADFFDFRIGYKF